MIPVSLRQPETVSEAWFYNQGVLDVLVVAKRSAETIGVTGKRPVHERFATAALDELVDAGMALLIKEGDAPACDSAITPFVNPQPMVTVVS